MSWIGIGKTHQISHVTAPFRNFITPFLAHNNVELMPHYYDSISLQDAQFDIIICCGVMNEVSDSAHFLDSLAQGLKSKGELIPTQSLITWIIVASTHSLNSTPKHLIN